MRKLIFVIFSLLFSLNGSVYAEDYNECRTACDKAFQECRNQTSAFVAVNPGLFAEAEAECRGKADKCNAACEGLQKGNEGIQENEMTPPPSSSQEEE